MATLKYKDPNTGEFVDLLDGNIDTLPINSVIEYTGDGVPDGFIEVKDESVSELLWENPDSSKSVTTLTVNLPKNNYKFYTIFMRGHTSSPYEQAFEVRVGKQSALLFHNYLTPSGKYYLFSSRRYVTATQTSVTFGENISVYSGSTTPYTSPEVYNIPVAIYGHN